MNEATEVDPSFAMKHMSVLLLLLITLLLVLCHLAIQLLLVVLAGLLLNSFERVLDQPNVLS
ncbi:hypothetical protein BU25DRAFT_110667 [Macroventuria anomochaeta]|uniref:Uncharacterized protein n=1 Tax=Macroventuria anomochaeta TaxID=301207 RepID=A0ACB6RVG2_9PLEO|nr:uncharacterized protein BU25DRAFT_110667 [Macroventuria anomochaeta]KAF2625759.1 hypothetical protein BU25DRAFT_110667 [Macroventuria anomochaeta]